MQISTGNLGDYEFHVRRQTGVKDMAGLAETVQALKNLPNVKQAFFKNIGRLDRLPVLVVNGKILGQGDFNSLLAKAQSL